MNQEMLAARMAHLTDLAARMQRIDQRKEQIGQMIEKLMDMSGSIASAWARNSLATAQEDAKYYAAFALAIEKDRGELRAELDELLRGE